jgi:hypothetical protein
MKIMHEVIDLGKKLKTDFPEMFPQNIYVEIGSGWNTLVYTLCNAIDSYLENVNPYRERKKLEKVPQVVVVQIKEKFGGLRFYYDGGDEYVRGLCDMAERTSYVTCEQCGNPGVLRGGYWMHTACDIHSRET